jgi:nicotinamide mononucleotide transporter
VLSLLAALDPLEAAGVGFSVLYLVLAIRESLWCWPAAFLSSVLTVIVLAEARLYSEAALNVFYAAMAVYGWMQWRYGGGDEKELPISTWPVRTHALALAGVAVASSALGFAMHRYTGAAFPYLDALVTVSSVVTTYMVAKKILENWIYWLAIDSVSLTLYVARDLYLYAGLFALYLVLAAVAFQRWRREWRVQGALVAA